MSVPELDRSTEDVLARLEQLVARFVAASSGEEPVDDCLDAVVDAVGAERAMLVLAFEDGTNAVVHARGGGRALSARERDEVSATLVKDALARDELAVFDLFDGASGTASLVERGVTLAWAAPFRGLARAAGLGGVLYVDFRDAAAPNGPRARALFRVAASVLGASLAERARLARATEALRGATVRTEPERVPPLDALLSPPSMREIRRELASALNSRAPILITGESGTGKTLLARAIAAASGRTPVVRAMLGTSDDFNTIVSELFGHERGAYSGALAKRTGLVEFADGGTLIFDEVLNLPRAAQQLLLDFVQFGTYRPLGHARPEPKQANVRIVAATNGDLPRAIAEGRFREDLYFRLAGITLHLPPLRERRDEIPDVANRLLPTLDRGRGMRLAPSARRLLVDPTLAWAGNVRQLEHALQRALDRALASVGSEDALGELDLSHFEARDLGREATSALGGEGEARELPVAPESADAWQALQREREALEAREAALIRAALARHGGVVARAARELGMPRTSLASRVAALGLGDGDPLRGERSS